MSLVGTLGKVAVGILVAKSVGGMMGGGSNSNSGLGGVLGSLMGGGSSSGGLGGLLGSLAGGNSSAGGLGGLLGSLAGGGGSSGGLGSILGSIAGGGGNSSGGLGDILGSLAGGNTSSGGLGGMLGSLAGGGGNAGGSGLGGLLGGLLSGAGGDQGSASAAGGLGGLLGSLAGSQSTASNNFGAMFNDALQGKEPEQVSAHDERTAELLMRAMISAAKADGKIDPDEQHKIVEHLNDASDEEKRFVQRELQAPTDLQGLVKSVPAGMEQQVYLMSLLAINLDSKEEAVYLDQLAKGLHISAQACNQIHDQLGVPHLYS